MTQQQVLTILKTGASVFLTGEPGSGKTHTIREYISWLRRHKIQPAITASTGIAATHIGGFTVHSWSGIGIKDTLTRENRERLRNNRRLVERAQNARVLIIDEISMLSAAVFSAVDTACQTLRGNPAPFGGMQVVLVGDFFQLPPVVSRDDSVVEERTLFADSPDDMRAQFAFRSTTWQKLSPLVCYLSQQYRQEDLQFLSILSAIRHGNIEPQQRAKLLSQDISSLRVATPGENITQLYSHNIDVDRINAAKLKKIDSKPRTFSMHRDGPAKLTQQLMRGCLSPETLTLKKGARVMFTKNNFQEKFVNGTTGTILGFDATQDNYPIVKTHGGRTIAVLPMEWTIESEGKILARIKQVPLRLAWAITVHKSQGMSLDAAHMDLSRSFEYGQGYVALSRVRSLAGLSLAGLNRRALQVHPSMRKKDEIFKKKSAKVLEALSKASTQDIKEKHRDFIVSSGGTLEPVKNTAPSADKLEESNKTTYEKTKELLQDDKDVQAVSEERELTTSTVWRHIEKLAFRSAITLDDIAPLVPDTEKWQTAYSALCSAMDECGTKKLKPLYEHTNEHYDYDTIRLARIVYTLKNS